MAGDGELEDLVRELTARDPPALTPTRVFDPSLASRIERVDAPEIVRAVLHLMNDEIERAHEIAQGGEGEPTHDYVHAIVHRRGGDLENSKYWLARARSHPVIPAVYGVARGAAAAFVDRCGREPRDADLVTTQWRELKALLDHARGAAGHPRG